MKVRDKPTDPGCPDSEPTNEFWLLNNMWIPEIYLSFFSVFATLKSANKVTGIGENS